MRIGKMNTLCIQPLSGLGFSAAVSGSRVDREAGVIRGVAVITEGVAKGHGVKVDAVTLRQVFNNTQLSARLATGLEIGRASCRERVSSPV